jgi:hypothetical protein
MYAGFENDCSAEVRELINEYGESSVWVFGMLIDGYPVTFHYEKTDSQKLSDYLLTRKIRKWRELYTLPKH